MFRAKMQLVVPYNIAHFSWQGYVGYRVPSYEIIIKTIIVNLCSENTPISTKTELIE